MYNPFTNNATSIDENNIKQSNAPLSGIAAQYKTQLQGCKFKLIVYFDKKPSGEFYTTIEKQYMKHRRPIPSFDFKNGTSRKSITDHETAYNNLVKYMIDKKTNISKCMLIYNDYINKQEKTIFICNPNKMDQADFREVKFTAPDENNNIFFEGIIGQYIRIDNMISYEK